MHSRDQTESLQVVLSWVPPKIRAWDKGFCTGCLGFVCFSESFLGNKRSGTRKQETRRERKPSQGHYCKPLGPFYCALYEDSEDEAQNCPSDAGREEFLSTGPWFCLVKSLQRTLTPLQFKVGTCTRMTKGSLISLLLRNKSALGQKSRGPENSWDKGIFFAV